MTRSDPTITIKGRNQSGRAFKQARTDLDKLKQTARGVGLALGAVSFAGLAIMKQQIDQTKQTVAYSKALGVSTEALTQFQFAADSVGIAADKVGDIMKDTAEKIGDAFRNEAGEAKEALESMGLDIERLAQMSPDDQLFAIAAGLDAVGTQGEKVQILEAIANDASLLLPLLEDNAKGLREMADQADHLGATLTQIEADKIIEADKALRELGGVWDGFTQALTAEFAPAMATAIRAIAVHLPRSLGYMQEVLEETYNWLFPSSFDAGPMDDLIIKRTNLIKQLGDAEAMQLDTMAAKLRLEIEQTENQIDALERKGRIMAENRENAVLEVDIDEGISAQEHLDQAMQDQLNALYAFEDAKAAASRAGVKKRLEFETWGAKEQTKHVVGEAIRLTRGVTQESRKLFELNKAAGIANAIINAHEGASKSLTAYPWPLAGAMAALHLASGLAQVSAIRSASFGGGGGGGGAPSSAASGGTPSNPVPLTDPGATGGPPGASERGGVQIIIEGNVYANEDFRAALVDALHEANQLDELQDIRITNNG